MGWGQKAIEIRNLDGGEMDGVFMHKKAQKLKFLCEKNDKANFLFFKHEFQMNSYSFVINVTVTIYSISSH